MSQHRFRVNPVKSYSERMTETRSELRKLVRERLCDITGEPSAQMRWAQGAYMRDVVARYRVRIEGWPLREVPFKNLSDVPNLRRLELLLRNWKEGKIYFRRITEEEYQTMVADPSPWLEYVETGEGEHGEPEAADDA
ncbi:hypothetical protein C8Q70DRAFT_1042069 [Cubamyces menziesii]|uniref:Uncharacterized protein n=1 Tax=Trametes cubensis TaxID=1111947 RepID=A0AAD7XD29_9APHY|nr:hypothetical protein C8Q70DRAFT_1042069 [Cubamyces menziesii]KAJ8496034.1 hypothetical protein ONZ51_g1339 [Trametes cubensis]